MDTSMQDTILMVCDAVLYTALAVYAALIIRYFLIRREDMSDEQ